MKRFLLIPMFTFSLVFGALSMTGCNTFRGMAADSRETINAVPDGPHDAYHQEARDF